MNSESVVTLPCQRKFRLATCSFNIFITVVSIFYRFISGSGGWVHRWSSGRAMSVTYIMTQNQQLHQELVQQVWQPSWMNKQTLRLDNTSSIRRRIQKCKRDSVQKRLKIHMLISFAASRMDNTVNQNGEAITARMQ